MASVVFLYITNSQSENVMKRLPNPGEKKHLSPYYSHYYS